MGQEAFGDIPLFREIQRILSAGEGPINLELSRQVATAIATQGAPDARADADVSRSFAAALHDAETLLSGYTRLHLDEPMRHSVMGRVAWLESTLDGWRWLLEHMARRFTGELARLSPQDERANPMQAALEQVSPLLVGIQTGTLIGHLAREALARYDLPIPRDDDNRLFFVTSNVAGLARDYSFDLGLFVRWLTLHEAARHLITMSVPWVGRFWRGLLVELVDAIELDVADVERRLMDLQAGGMDVLQEGMGAESALPIVETERHRRALDRLRAFIAAFEGYAMHAATAVAGQVVGDTAKIDEGMARHRASPSDGKAMLSGVLGLSLDRARDVSGTTFCAAVSQLKGMSSLNQVWAAPDNLPTIEEVKDPFAWIDRVLAA